MSTYTKKHCRLVAKLINHIKAMESDAYLVGHPEWNEIVKDADNLTNQIKQEDAKINLINLADLHELADKYITDCNCNEIEGMEHLYLAATSILLHTSSKKQDEQIASYYNKQLITGIYKPL